MRTNECGYSSRLVVCRKKRGVELRLFGTSALVDGTPWLDQDGSPLIVVLEGPETSEAEVDKDGLCRVFGWSASKERSKHTVEMHRAGRRQIAPEMSERPDVQRHLTATMPGRFDGGFCQNLSVYLYLPPDESERTYRLVVSDSVHVADLGRIRIFRAGSTTETDKGFERSRYKDVWNSVSVDLDNAKTAVAGYTDEDEFQRTALATVAVLEESVGIGPEDVVLEIGAGVGRVGPVLAPKCKQWIATDVSEQMLMFAKERNKDYPNISYVPLSGWDLEPVPSESIDVVYSTVVFMHLDEWERFTYVCEAMRVLRPGGRLYIDNYNLLSEPGWQFFSGVREFHHALNRPPNVSRSSTPAELAQFLIKAGFEDVRPWQDSASLFCHVTGRKPQ